MRRIMIYCILGIAMLLPGCAKEVAENTPTIPINSTESLAIVEETAPITEEVIIQETASEVQQIEAIVKEFTDAYFAADSDVMKKHLSASHNVELTVYEEGDGSKVVINAIKGLDNIPKELEEKGHCNISVEFKKSADSDYFLYLSITLIQEDRQWKVLSYGLEG